MSDLIPDRSDLRDGGIVGTAIAGVLDLALLGGETLVALAWVLIDSIELWIAVLGQLSRLSDVTDVIPGGAVETALVVAGALFVIVTIVRIGQRIRSGIADN